MCPASGTCRIGATAGALCESVTVQIDPGLVGDLVGPLEAVSGAAFSFPACSVLCDRVT